MHALFRAAVPALLLAVSCQTITDPDLTVEPEPEPIEEAYVFRVEGYHAWWSGDEWLTYDFNQLDALYFFDLTVDEFGEIEDRHGWPEDWTQMTDAARAAGAIVKPTITILDATTFSAVFSDPAAQDTLFARTVELATGDYSDGIHVDFEVFESVTPGVREAFSSYLRRVRTYLDESAPDAELSVFTLSMDPAEVFDEVAIADAAHHLVVQAYDLHWSTSAVAGPVAPLTGWGGNNWESVLATFKAKGIETNKLSFSVPYYGYEWPTDHYLPGAATRGPGVELAYVDPLYERPSARDRAAEHGKLRDPQSGSAYYAYQDSTGWYQGWFEDEYSLSEKYRFITENRLRGVAVFPLAYGDATLAGTLVSARAQFASR